MTVDRDKLWAAFPSGFLARRGVSTLDGRMCLGDDEKLGAIFAGAVVSEIIATGDNQLYGTVSHAVDLERQRLAGDLLPDVDPADVASWACLLEEFSALQGHKPSSPPTVPNLTWMSAGEHGWRFAGFYTVPGPLSMGAIDVCGSCCFDKIDGGLPPAEALIEAFIQLREEPQK